MSKVQELSVEQFKLACVSDDVLTDDQVMVLARRVVMNSEDDVREFTAVVHKYRPNLEMKFFPETPYSEKEVLEMWPQSAGELRNLRNHFMRTNAGITAAQLSMALQLAEAEFKRLQNKS